jgi:hypothetical protein
VYVVCSLGEGGHSRLIAVLVPNIVEGFIPYVCQKLSQGVSEIFKALPNFENITYLKCLVRFGSMPALICIAAMPIFLEAEFAGKSSIEV